MDKDQETEKTEEKKLRDLTPEKDAKGGMRSAVAPDRPSAGSPAQKSTYSNVKGVTTNK